MASAQWIRHKKNRHQINLIFSFAYMRLRNLDKSWTQFTNADIKQTNTKLERFRNNRDGI